MADEELLETEAAEAETEAEETEDLIDTLIDALNDGVPGVTFDRDALETDRPDDWGAVELTGEGESEWADGNEIDQTLNIDIWVCVSEHGSRIKRKVQAVLRQFCTANDGGWKFVSRNYIYDLDKVIWRWTANVWAPLGGGAAASSGTEEADEPDATPVQQNGGAAASSGTEEAEEPEAADSEDGDG